MKNPTLYSLIKSLRAVDSLSNKSFKKLQQQDSHSPKLLGIAQQFKHNAGWASTVITIFTDSPRSLSRRHEDELVTEIIREPKGDP